MIFSWVSEFKGMESDKGKRKILKKEKMGCFCFWILWYEDENRR